MLLFHLPKRLTESATLFELSRTTQKTMKGLPDARSQKEISELLYSRYSQPFISLWFLFIVPVHFPYPIDVSFPVLEVLDVRDAECLCSHLFLYLLFDGGCGGGPLFHGRSGAGGRRVRIGAVGNFLALDPGSCGGSSLHVAVISMELMYGQCGMVPCPYQFFDVLLCLCCQFFSLLINLILVFKLTLIIWKVELYMIIIGFRIVVV